MLGLSGLGLAHFFVLRGTPSRTDTLPGVKVMTVGKAKIASIATFTPTRPSQTQLGLTPQR